MKKEKEERPWAPKNDTRSDQRENMNNKNKEQDPGEPKARWAARENRDQDNGCPASLEGSGTRLGPSAAGHFFGGEACAQRLAPNVRPRPRSASLEARPRAWALEAPDHLLLDSSAP